MKAKLVTTDLNSNIYWHEEERDFGALDCCHQINIFPTFQKQIFHGFGGAFTEAAARCWSRLPEDRAKALIDSYFGSEGLCYTMGRVPMGSSDFSVGHYSCVDSADEPEDTFRTDIDDKYLIPMILAAQKSAAKPVRLLLSPWSPPPL